MSILYLLLYDHYAAAGKEDKKEDEMGFSLKSNLHPPRQKDFSRFSTWRRSARDIALGDYGIKRVSDQAYRDLFEAGLTPQEAALRLAEWSRVN